jgi:hypothetical protein
LEEQKREHKGMKAAWLMAANEGEQDCLQTFFRGVEVWILWETQAAYVGI